MPWEIFTGGGQPQSRPPAPAGEAAVPAWRAIPKPPPWRRGVDDGDGDTAASTPPPFKTTPPLVEAVNAALHLRRPLLLTGLPGSGKSSLVDLIAAELELGEVLRWHVTSKSTLQDALYQYDALGRLQATQVASARGTREARRLAGQRRPPRPSGDETSVEHFVTLGPLGTALASPDRPRAVLIDEIDKSDLDLPGDLLNVLERGEFDIPPLVRDAATRPEGGEAKSSAGVEYTVRGADRALYAVRAGLVRTRRFPVIVFTSNGERTFPPPFLRRCVQFQMPRPNAKLLSDIVAAHLGDPAAAAEKAVIDEFARKLNANNTLAIDQLLNIVYLTTGEAAPGSSDRSSLEALLLTELGGR